MSSRRVALAFRLLAVTLGFAGLVLLLGDEELRTRTVPLLIAALVFAQLGGAFPTVRPEAARQLERLLDDARSLTSRLSTNLELFESGAHAEPGRHEIDDRPGRLDE